MAELPRGMVTFLFTDIVDRTALWERYPEVMGELLPATIISCAS